MLNLTIFRRNFILMIIQNLKKKEEIFHTNRDRVGENFRAKQYDQVAYKAIIFTIFYLHRKQNYYYEAKVCKCSVQ